MAATYTVLGDGTVTIGTVPVDFSCEVLGAKITHEYEEVGETRTTLCGEVRASSQTRSDGFSASVENDLTAAGLYAYLQTNDLTEQAFEFTPNTDFGASWTGTVIVTLPGEVGADEYGAPIASEIEWKAKGKLTFAPGVVVP